MRLVLALFHRWLWLLVHCWGGWCALTVFDEGRLAVIGVTRGSVGAEPERVFWRAKP